MALQTRGSRLRPAEAVFSLNRHTHARRGEPNDYAHTRTRGSSRDEPDGRALEIRPVDLPVRSGAVILCLMMYAQVKPL